MVTHRQLVPLWWSLAASLLTVTMTAVFALMAALADGAQALVGAVALVPMSLLCVTVWYVAWAPRRRRSLAVREDGSVELAAPAPLGWAVMGLWLSAPVLGAVAALVLVIDFSGVEGQGFLLLVAVGGLGSTPWALGVLTGRVRPWRLTVDGDGLRYRAMRSETVLRWDEVRGTDVERKPVAGLRIHRRGTEPGLVLMATVFTVPVDQIAEEMEQRRPR